MGTLQLYALSIFEKLPQAIRYTAMLGGGCFRSFYDFTPVKDYDLFFRSAQAWKDACSMLRDHPSFTELTKPGEEMYPSFRCGDDKPFNLIGFRFHDSPMSLYRSFDFVCCAFSAAYYGFPEGQPVEVFQHPHAAYDAAHRRLNFQNLQNLARVERRRDRYVNDYGYEVTEEFKRQLPSCAHVPTEHGSGGY